jgi:DNA (cytosine-5)-methyltransferase 1
VFVVWRNCAAAMIAFYNEIDEYAAQWLRNLIEAGEIMPGVVDTRSITEIDPDELTYYTQVHLFAGIGGWSLAARLAGWPDDRELWTGSAPCQPFSVAGQQRGAADERHLWPDYFRLVRARRPAVCVGEQVAAAVGKDWLDGVFTDLEGVGYACGATVVPACAVNAPHRRDRIYWVAGNRVLDYGYDPRLERLGGHVADGGERSQPSGSIAATGRGSAYDLADTTGTGLEKRERDAGVLREVGGEPEGQDVADDVGAWDSAEWIIGHGGKARRVKPGIRLLAHGVPARVGKLRAYGNAIVPQEAAEVLGAWLECMP